VNATTAVHAVLTALFAAGTVHALWYGVPAHAGWRTPVDHRLHTAMVPAMAVMPWHSGRAPPELPQTVFFAAADFWYGAVSLGTAIMLFTHT
jgi:hypothetical protein